MLKTLSVENFGPSSSQIKVLRPRLPVAAKLLPYLDRIDSTRIYSNYGPLNAEFVQRLGEFVGGSLVTLTSSGTTAIELALRLHRRQGIYCLMPSFTFIASAHAVCNAGLVPYLVETDPDSLALTPEIAKAALASIGDSVAAVLVVSAFGAPPDLAVWAKFEQENKIPVVFDAAAALTSLSGIGSQPVCVSLHATKTLGIGEGGAILCGNRDLIDRATAMTGFGFAGNERMSSMRAGNYRISEYAAAVGLAGLDGLPARINEMKRLTAAYAYRLEGKSVRLQRGVGIDWVTMTLNVVVPSEDVDATTLRLDDAKVEWRRWWGAGCHRHPAFKDVPASDLSATDALSPRVIGLPFHDDLSSNDLDRVTGCLR
ncbi:MULTISPECIES: DegT/DnrJ/EryC1/StrS family aminotransferase [unclassified Variovorax]|uniref:DegT/DnrJ/EryC1/StrS family aminotransferase n=1 Tax=unclassified Variovorax TaxID=663243 RepID=UPI000D11D86D|nr:MULTISPECIES: DegT/DnrJ/EryC1/StrS family aminotransferase [unclassified Variovorax]AVQ82224.1 degt/dnrj/eryc1/strs aminotransferase [Variovorax sp. PMC12]QRY33515.1 DegT/DnrJ/EryC1/StrS family aminotransferase [Variovorax sp. PDNC026]